MCSINCIYSPVNKGFIGEISYLRSHNTFKSTSQKLIKYYTDHHDVDEDHATIPSLGEHWRGNMYAGLHCRHIDWYPSTTANVASSDIRNWSFDIRIFMMSTKIRGPLLVKVDVGVMVQLQVLQLEMCFILPLQLTTLLLLKIITHSPYNGRVCDE